MASSDANMKLTRDLTATEIKEIYYLSNKKEILGKEKLAKRLGIPPFQDKNDLQKPLFISYIFDNIKYAAEKGVPWGQITKVVKFAYEFLKRIWVENHKLGDAILDLKSLSYLLDSLSDHHRKQYLDFIYVTILTHYNLYKYVFSNLRGVVHPKIHKYVDIPPKPLALVYAKEKSIFEYDEKFKKLDMLEAETISQLKQTLLSKNMQESHKQVSDLDEVPLPYSKMQEENKKQKLSLSLKILQYNLTLDELVKDIVSGIMEKKENEFLFQAKETIEDLSFKFEKAIIPRPVIGTSLKFELKHDPRSNVTISSDAKSGKSTSMSVKQAASRAK